MSSPHIKHTTSTIKLSLVHDINLSLPSWKCLDHSCPGLISKDDCANPDFNMLVIATSSRVVPLESGIPGHINFYPLMRCVSGSMIGCNGDIEDGLDIEACAPVASRRENFRWTGCGAEYVWNRYWILSDPFAGLESPVCMASLECCYGGLYRIGHISYSRTDIMAISARNSGIGVSRILRLMPGLVDLSFNLV